MINMMMEEESKEPGNKIETWGGQVQVNQMEQTPLSKFHQELIDYEEY